MIIYNILIYKYIIIYIKKYKISIKICKKKKSMKGYVKIFFLLTRKLTAVSDIYSVRPDRRNYSSKNSSFKVVKS